MSDSPETPSPRQVARYPLALTVRVQAEGGSAQSCRVCDVGGSGMFLASESPPALYSHVSIAVALPNGEQGGLVGRVVHVLGLDKARVVGTSPGFDVQFEPLGRREQALLDALVSLARSRTNMREERVRAEPRRGGLSIPPPAPGPGDGSDEVVDLRFSPPPADAAPTAQHRRPVQTSSRPAREPSARALAAVAALRRPSRAPSAPLSGASPPTAAGRTQPASSLSGAPRSQPSVAGGSQRPPGAVAGAGVRSQPSAAGGSQRPSGAVAGAGVRSQPSAAGGSQRPFGAVAGAGVRSQPSAAGETLRPASASRPPSAMPSRSEPPAARRTNTGRPSRVPVAGSRSGRPSRPAAAAQAEAAAQAAAEQAAAAAALSARGRPSQSPGPTRLSQPASEGPPLGAAGQILAQAEAAHSAGNDPEASRHLKLLLAMTFDDPRLQARFAELKHKLMRTASVDFEKRALHQEKQQHWAEAARSWLRVAEGRPDDSYPLQRAALALLEAGTELRAAIDHAKRAVELAPHEAEAHRTLAKVYVAADMQASARAALEAAQRCSGAGDASEEGPTGLLKRLLGRDNSD